MLGLTALEAALRHPCEFAFELELELEFFYYQRTCITLLTVT